MGNEQNTAQYLSVEQLKYQILFAESRDLQYEVVKLRALVPQNYQKHLHRENKQYFKQLVRNLICFEILHIGVGILLKRHNITYTVFANILFFDYFVFQNAIEVRVQPTNNATNVQRYEFAIDDNLVEWQRYTLNVSFFSFKCGCNYAHQILTTFHLFVCRPTDPRKKLID